MHLLLLSLLLLLSNLGYFFANNFTKFFLVTYKITLSYESLEVVTTLIDETQILIQKVNNENKFITHNFLFLYIDLLFQFFPSYIMYLSKNCTFYSYFFSKLQSLDCFIVF